MHTWDRRVALTRGSVSSSNKTVTFSHEFTTPLQLRQLSLVCLKNFNQGKTETSGGFLYIQWITFLKKALFSIPLHESCKYVYNGILFISDYSRFLTCLIDLDTVDAPSPGTLQYVKVYGRGRESVEADVLYINISSVKMSSVSERTSST